MVTKKTPPSNKRAKRVGMARNAVSSWLAFLVVAGVSFFLSPFVVHRLGDAGYGVWSLLVSLVGYLGLLDFGVRGAITRYIAHHYAAGDHDDCSSIATAGLALFAMLGLVAIALASIVAYLAPTLFNIPASLHDETRTVLVIGGFTIAVTLIGNVFAGIVTGLERFDVSASVEIVVTLVRAAAVVWALHAGLGLVSLAVIHLLTAVLIGAVAWVNARKLFPALQLRFHQPLRAHIRTILSFSTVLSVIHVFGMMMYYGSTVVIAMFLPISMATFFAIAVNLCDYAAKLSGTLSKIVMPRVSALSSVDSGEIGAEITRIARIATLVSTPIAITFLFRGESFIDLWMGDEYGPTSGQILRMLAFMVWLGGARSVGAAAIIGANKHRILVPVFAGEAVSNLTLSVSLVGLLGLPGVALGSLIPNMTVSLAFIPSCLSRACGVPVRRFFLDAWILPTLACVPFGVATILFELLAPATGMLMFGIQVLLALTLVPLGAYPLCLTAVERRRVGLAFRNVATDIS